jgi:hypothetical protein
MSIKNFKGFKNYQKRSPRGSMKVLTKESKELRFQKDKLWPLLVKCIPTLLVSITGYWLLDLPGALIGCIFGYQIGKFLLKPLQKKFKILRESSKTLHR